MTSSDGLVLGITKLVDHGSTDRRFNIVFLSEGYQANQLSNYVKTVDDAVAALRIMRPFRELWPTVNVFRVDVTSTDSGADVPATGTVRRTFFDARLPGEPRVVRCDEAAVHRLCEAQISKHHVPVVIVNIPGNFGTASHGVAMLGSAVTPLGGVVAHEIGHSAFGLADEYDEQRDPARFSGRITVEPNVTTTTDPAKLPWRALANLPLTAVPNPDCSKASANGAGSPPASIGLFEGANHAHCGVFRPAGDCRMRNAGESFCTVCAGEARRTLRHFPPVAIERGRFAVPVGDLKLAAPSIAAGPSVLVYDTATGAATLQVVASDVSALTLTFSNTWNTGVSQTVPLGLPGRTGLLLYNATSGKVEIDAVSDDGSRIVTLWPGVWTTGWTAMTSYTCNGEPFLFSYKSASGRAAIDRVADDGADVTSRFDGTVDAEMTHFAAVERTDPLGQPFHPGGALIVGYRADTGVLIAWGAPDDGSALVELTRLSTLPFATAMVPLVAHGELMLALYNAVSGEVRWLFVGDLGVDGSNIGAIAPGISVEELGATTWGLGWTAFAPFLLGGENHLFAQRPDGTLVIDQIA